MPAIRFNTLGEWLEIERFECAIRLELLPLMADEQLFSDGKYIGLNA